MHIFGLLATITNVFCILVGLVSQIRENRRRQSCEGLSKTFYVTLFLVYLFWSLHGWQIGDAYLVVAQSPGCVVSAFLLRQFYVYRKPPQ